MTNILLNGKHFFEANHWEIDWKLAPTQSFIYDPDIRFTRYEQRINGNDTILSIGTESGFPERIWRELEETNLAGYAMASKEFKVNNQKSKITFGGGYVYKERDFVIRNFALNIRNVPLTGDPDELFFPENLWPRNDNISSGTTYEAPFIPVNPNQFDANTQNLSGFISAEMGVTSKLKVIAGLRAENFTQNYTGQDQLGTNVLNNERVLDDLGLFPSVNLIYNITENQNLRFSFAQTIARPSFKELSYAEIFDPISGRTFIGGLFRDANDVAGIEYWDGNLQSTDIQNYDLRWEMFLPEGQLYSLSLFFKKFNRPIELVQYATQTGSFQPRNVGDGQVAGFELEVRKNLGFLSIMLQDFSFNANFTYTQSRIKLSSTEFESRKENARTGQSVDEYRDMAGQAPYLLNAGVAWNGGQKGFSKGLEAGVYYNVQGETLTIVGIADRPDIYTVPFHSLNFNANKTFGKNNKMSVGLKIENLLKDKNETVFKSYNASNQIFTRLSSGTKFTLRFGYNIF
jgi:outer membrane receptor protein involved in Fe transport